MCYSEAFSCVSKQTDQPEMWTAKLISAYRIIFKFGQWVKAAVVIYRGLPRWGNLVQLLWKRCVEIKCPYCHTARETPRKEVNGKLTPDERHLYYKLSYLFVMHNTQIFVYAHLHLMKMKKMCTLNGSRRIIHFCMYLTCLLLELLETGTQDLLNFPIQVLGFIFGLTKVPRSKWYCLDCRRLTQFARGNRKN